MAPGKDGLSEARLSKPPSMMKLLRKVSSRSLLRKQDSATLSKDSSEEDSTRASTLTEKSPTPLDGSVDFRSARQQLNQQQRKNKRMSVNFFRPAESDDEASEKTKEPKGNRTMRGRLGMTLKRGGDKKKAKSKRPSAATDATDTFNSFGGEEEFEMSFTNVKQIKQEEEEKKRGSSPRVRQVVAPKSNNRKKSAIGRRSLLRPSQRASTSSRRSRRGSKNSHKNHRGSSASRRGTKSSRRGSTGSQEGSTFRFKPHPPYDAKDVAMPLPPTIPEDEQGTVETIDDETVVVEARPSFAKTNKSAAPKQELQRLFASQASAAVTKTGTDVQKPELARLFATDLTTITPPVTAVRERKKTLQAEQRAAALKELKDESESESEEEEETLILDDDDESSMARPTGPSIVIKKGSAPPNKELKRLFETEVSASEKPELRRLFASGVTNVTLPVTPQREEKQRPGSVVFKKPKKATVKQSSSTDVSETEGPRGSVVYTKPKEKLDGKDTVAKSEISHELTRFFSNAKLPLSEIEEFDIDGYEEAMGSTILLDQMERHVSKPKQQQDKNREDLGRLFGSIVKVDGEEVAPEEKPKRKSYLERLFASNATKQPEAKGRVQGSVIFRERPHRSIIKAQNGRVSVIQNPKDLGRLFSSSVSHTPLFDDDDMTVVSATDIHEELSQFVTKLKGDLNQLDRLLKKRDKLEQKKKAKKLKKEEPVVRKQRREERHVNLPTPEETYEVLSLLGRGTFGEVRKVKVKMTGAFLAAKICVVGGSEDVTALRGEVELLKRFQSCPYIVRFVTDFTTPFKETWIVTELCEGGDVATLMEVAEVTLTEPQIKSVIACVLLALCRLHDKKIVHRDVKGANILLSASGLAKLSDLGVSKQMPVEKMQSKEKQMREMLRGTTTGSPYWMSPEIAKGGNYNFQVDIWSLGITCIELAQGDPPMADNSVIECHEQIANYAPQGLKNPEDFSAEMSQFIARCLTPDPMVRPTAEALCDDIFIVEQVNDLRLLEAEGLFGLEHGEELVEERFRSILSQKDNEMTDVVDLACLRTLFVIRHIVLSNSDVIEQSREQTPTKQKRWVKRRKSEYD